MMDSKTNTCYFFYTVYGLQSTVILGILAWYRQIFLFLVNNPVYYTLQYRHPCTNKGTYI